MSTPAPKKPAAGGGEKKGWKTLCDDPNVKKGAAVVGAVAVVILGIFLVKSGCDDDGKLDTKGSVARAPSKEDYLEYAKGQSY